MTDGFWETFQLVHVLDPNRPENKDYANWCGSKWRKWMRKRDEEILRLAGSQPQRRQVDSNGRFVNSVLIASPLEILHSFTNKLKKYDLLGNKYWSNRPFKMYLIDRSDPSNEVRCYESVYFVATLDQHRRPIRFKMFNAAPNTNTRNQGVSTLVPDSSPKTCSLCNTLRRLALQLFNYLNPDTNTRGQRSSALIPDSSRNTRSTETFKKLAVDLSESFKPP